MLESISNTFTPHRNRPSSKSSAHFQKENRESDPNFLFLVSFEKNLLLEKNVEARHFHFPRHGNISRKQQRRFRSSIQLDTPVSKIGPNFRLGYTR